MGYRLSDTDPMFEIADFGDEIAPGIRVGDRVEAPGTARWISNITGHESDRRTPRRVVVTPLNPNDWEPGRPQHGSWTYSNRITVRVPRVTKKEIAELFGISPKKVP